jgi:lysophospholipase L1-like esterase
MSTPQSRRDWRIVALVSAAVAILIVALLPTANRLITNMNLPHGAGINTVAVIGDSASSAENSCGEQLLCYDNSWAGGSNKAVNSIVTRLAKAEKHRVATFNYAYPGSRLRDLAPQAKKAVDQQVDAIILLVGANDFCQESTSQMTSAARYTKDMRTLITDLHQALPKTKLFIASVPDPRKVYTAGANSTQILGYWSSHDICRSLLRDPTDDSISAQQRRSQVEQRASQYNQAIETLCTAAMNCGYDQGALHGIAFTPQLLSPVDHFHPSVLGQAKVAETEWPSAKQFLLGKN